MSRSTDALLQELLAELPAGEALPRDPSGNVGKFLRPIAAELSAFEEKREELLAQFSPLSAIELLPDYERILGPDPCKADTLALPLDERQRRAEVRWNGGTYQLGPETLARVAATLGVTVSVEIFHPDVCGDGECGEDTEIGPETEIYGWWVHAPADAADAGLACVLAQFVPPHRYLRISYDL